MDDKSRAFLDEIADPVNLNIDSILVIGKKYKVPFLLVEYLTLGEVTKDAAVNKQRFFQYLERYDIHFFTYRNVYYTDIKNVVIKEAPYISLLRLDMTKTKRSWIKLDDENGYKLNLLYTLQNEETKLEAKERNDRSIQKDKVLKELYWKSEGEFTKEYKDGLQKIYNELIAQREEQLHLYIEKGKIPPFE